MTIQEEFWDLLTTGNVEQTHTKESVIALLQLKLCTEEQAKILVSGAQKVLKKNLSVAQLKKLEMAFHQTGLEVFTRPSLINQQEVISSLALVEDDPKPEKAISLVLEEDDPEPEIKAEQKSPVSEVAPEPVESYSKTRQMVCPSCKKIQPTSKECIYCSCYVDTFFCKKAGKIKRKKAGLVDKLAFWKK